MSGRAGPERRGPERPGPDYPPEWDTEPDENDEAEARERRYEQYVDDLVATPDEWEQLRAAVTASIDRAIAEAQP